MEVAGPHDAAAGGALTRLALLTASARQRLLPDLGVATFAGRVADVSGRVAFVLDEEGRSLPIPALSESSTEWSGALVSVDTEDLPGGATTIWVRSAFDSVCVLDPIGNLSRQVGQVLTNVDLDSIHAYRPRRHGSVPNRDRQRAVTPSIVRGCEFEIMLNREVGLLARPSLPRLSKIREEPDERRPIEYEHAMGHLEFAVANLDHETLTCVRVVRVAAKRRSEGHRRRRAGNDHLVHAESLPATHRSTLTDRPLLGPTIRRPVATGQWTARWTTLPGVRSVPDSGQWTVR